MAVARRVLVSAIVASILSALLWATYYLFVLWVTPGTAPSAILVYPFLFGGVAYSLWAVARGHSRVYAALWRSPMAYARVGLLFGMQVSVLAATYLTGPVDASLLSLIGDVVLTPIIVAMFLVAYRAHIATPTFAVGLVVSLAGGTMAIVGGQSLSSVHGWGWFAVPGVPLCVALYFLLTARANRTMAPSAVVGQSMLAAGILTAVVAPAFPGGWHGLVAIAPLPFFLMAMCGITSFFLAPALYFLALDEVGLVIPPMLMTAIPVFTLLLSAEVLGIALPLIGVLGIPVAVAGGVIALRGESVAPAEDVMPPVSPGI
ncbi:MAG TPA: DMT family transporter [Thermoplasmata archaeon]|nr:DMT family transporter [Thermoplasmata archaeon]